MKKILLLLLFVLLVSCKAEDDGILSVAVAQEPPTLDVMVNASVSGRNILVGNVYERLFTIDGASIVPCLAEGYELTDDGHTLEIEIRKGVSFHDGSSLDAEDVVSSLNRWLDVYGNAEKLVDGATFEISEGKVVIHSSSSLALLPYMLASSPQAAVIVPSASLSDLTENGLLKNAPGTGPYVVESWLPGDSIELDVFEGYWGDKPEIEAIKYSFVSDPVTRVLGIESGLYDFIDTVPSDDIPTLRDKGIELNQGGENGSIVLIFNKKEGISCDNDFRKAVSLLIDRDALMKACYGDYGYSVQSDYRDGESIWSVASSLDPYGEENDERGLEYLEAAGYDGQTVRILSSNLSNLDKIAVALSSELEEAGVDTELIILDWAAFSDMKWNSSRWDIYISATSSVILPIEKGYLFPSGAGGFDDEESERLIGMLSEASAEEEAVAIWNEAQKRLWEYIPVIVPGHYSTVYASSGVSGVDFSDGYSFRRAVLE